MGASLLVSIIRVVAKVTRYRARGFLAVAAFQTASLTDAAGNSNKSFPWFGKERRGINLFL